MAKAVKKVAATVAAMVIEAESADEAATAAPNAMFVKFAGKTDDEVAAMRDPDVPAELQWRAARAGGAE